MTIKEEIDELFSKSTIRKDGRRYYQGTYFAHIVWNLYNPDNKKVKGDKCIIHHRDQNPLNDNIGNLQKMTIGEHTTHHMTGNLVGEKNPMYGKTYTPEERKRISERQIGENNPMYGKGYLTSGEKNGMYGKKHTDESKRKQSEIKMGEKNPYYGKTGEKHHFYGKYHTEESRRKISESIKRRNKIKKGEI